MEIKKEPLETYYEILEDIGKGQFATVKRCIHKETQSEYAAKFIRKRRGGGRRGAKMEDIQKEIDILSSVSHRNIIRLYEVYETNREVILLLELVSGGELFEYLSEKDKLSEEEASAFIKQILDGVQHLHSKSIAHLDLKPENILLQDKNSTHVKLIDFGLSRKILPNEDNRAMMGTAEFVAPEVVSYEQLTLATDMWSIGVITYILLSGASPFLGDNQQETYHNITAVNYEFDEEYFNGTSEMAKGFIRSLLVKDKRKRATIKDCLNHPWIKPVEKKQRDLRRSSIIKTEHLKKFIARQRWKRSMRVVSLCNRLSRSLQLRRIQSTDTLGSCSEETTVCYSLSAPARVENIIKELADDSGSEKTPEITDLPADYLYRIVAKRIVDDVIDKVMKQHSNIRDRDDSSNVCLEDETDSYSVESINQDRKNLQEYVCNSKVQISPNFSNNSDKVEITCLDSSYLATILLPNECQETVLSGNDVNEFRETVEVLVQHSVGDEYKPVCTVENPCQNTSGNTETAGIAESIEVSVEHSVDSSVNGTDASDGSTPVKNKNLLAAYVSRRKLSRSRRKKSELDDIKEESGATVDATKNNSLDSLSDVLPANDDISIVPNRSICVDEDIEGIKGSVTQSLGDELNTDILDFNENITNKPFCINDKLNDIESSCRELDGIEFDELISQFVEAVIQSAKFQLKTEYSQGVHSQSDYKDEIKRKTNIDKTESETDLIDDYGNTNVVSTGNQKVDPRDARVIHNKVIINIEHIKSSSKMTQSNGNNENGSNDWNGGNEYNHSVTVPSFHVDPLNLLQYHNNMYNSVFARDLFDIPEELDADNTTEEFEGSISVEVKKKILRQRLRKKSLQRRVQAKIKQDTVFTEMTRFRKLRDEKRIESFEMKVLKH